MTTKEKTINNSRITIKYPDIGSILEGKVISKKKGEAFVDLSPYGIGRLYGIYYLESKNIISKMNLGDTVGVKIVGLDDGNGNYEIILQELSNIDKWYKILKYHQEGTILELEIKDANHGGLIVNIDDIQGFVPVSHLSPEYYPRVEANNKNLIYEHLKKFIGQKIKLKIISANPKTNKLVLSEKATKENIYKEILDKLIIGQIMKVKVVGFSSFGLFVRFNENPAMDGLIHISEIPDDKLDLEKKFKVGDVLEAKLIQIKKDKASFSLKDLSPDPWIGFAQKYKTGDKVKGTIKEKNDILAVVEIEKIQGVIFDELDKLEINKEYNFIIEKINPKEKSLILKLDK